MPIAVILLFALLLAGSLPLTVRALREFARVLPPSRWVVGVSGLVAA